MVGVVQGVKGGALDVQLWVHKWVQDQTCFKFWKLKPSKQAWVASSDPFWRHNGGRSKDASPLACVTQPR